jgi:hypothetical protein
MQREGWHEFVAAASRVTYAVYGEDGFFEARTFQPASNGVGPTRAEVEIPAFAGALFVVGFKSGTDRLYDVEGVPCPRTLAFEVDPGGTLRVGVTYVERLPRPKGSAPF